MLARSSSVSKDPKLLLDLNRQRLKKIFSRLHPSKDGRISFVDITKFCRNARLYPVTLMQDIVSTQDLKSMLEKIRPNYPTSSITISYLQFEQLLARIAALMRSVPVDARIQTVLELVQTHCGEHYGISFAYSASKQSLPPAFHFDSPKRPSTFHDRKYSESPRTHRASTSSSSKGNSFLDLQCSPRTKPFPPTVKSRESVPAAANPKLRGSRMSLSTTSYRAMNSARNRSQSKEIDPSHSLEDKNLTDLLVSKQLSTDSTPSSPYLRNISQTFEVFRLKHEMLAKRSKSLQKPVKTMLRHYQDFVWHVRTSSFSTNFVKRLLLHAWRQAVQCSRSLPTN